MVVEEKQQLRSSVARAKSGWHTGSMPEDSEWGWDPQ